jgi:histidinol dehydrogenase
MNIYKEPLRQDWARLLERPTLDNKDLEDIVKTVLERVKKEGDAALLAYTEKFDKVVLRQLEVTEEEFAEAEQLISPELKAAIQLAQKNIAQFHSQQKEKEQKVETAPGVFCWRKSVPIDKVGLYIPGGTAPLLSSVLMLGVPANIAGCKEMVLCSPPQKNGKVHPAVLYAAKRIGISQVFKVGGAQAIAAMAYGTESIPAVYKIFGPGNQYVTAAKQMVSLNEVAIDMPAGPSEVLVYADDSAHPDFVAADLLSQAEHGIDSQVVLLTASEKIANAVQQEIRQQLSKLPRKDIAEQALQNSVTIILGNTTDAIELINFYAPEHLILATSKPEEMAVAITNAGSVFLGHYTPESVGDYASGTNHTLPTNGFARMYSGVSLDSFIKKITFQQLSKEGLQHIGPAVEILAEAEELMAHKNAVSIRLKK